MTIKNERDWKYYHEGKSISKIKKIQKRLKKVGKIKIFKRTQYQKALLADILVMNEDLLDVLFVDKFKNIKDYLNTINAYLSLEHVTYNYKHPLEYKIGQMSEVVKLILLHHEIQETQNQL